MQTDAAAVQRVLKAARVEGCNSSADIAPYVQDVRPLRLRRRVTVLLCMFSAECTLH